MKAQSEIIIFVSLFLIGLVLFISSFIWSQGIIQKNQDINKLNELENFAIKLDSVIKDVIKFGGEAELEYNYPATVIILDDYAIEFKDTINIDIPEQWINITEDGVIREKKEGNLILIKIEYPENDYSIKFITDGPTLANPRKIKIQKSEVIYDPNFIIKIKVILE
ncbi:MAG: hypothetical protein J7K26_03800 [Candidatus Aenigmarchaeota archaeon]|nr:hypothetical protein [Candidatus Aenigmarchaeota archaeon]